MVAQYRELVDTVDPRYSTGMFGDGGRAPGPVDCHIFTPGLQHARVASWVEAAVWFIHSEPHE
jgi:hypothetical protein